MCVLFLCFKQKTAYEMRISDWSSDVCSSDLPYKGVTMDKRVRQAIAYALDVDEIIKGVLDGKAMRTATLLTPLHFGYDPALKPIKQDLGKIGRAACRERVCRDVEISVVAVSLNKTKAS